MNYKILFIIGKYPNISFIGLKISSKVFIIILLYFSDINTSLRSRRTLSRPSHARCSGTPQSTAWRSQRARVPWIQRRAARGTDAGEGVPILPRERVHVTNRRTQSGLAQRQALQGGGRVGK